MKRSFLFSILISLLFLSTCTQLITYHDIERQKKYIHLNPEISTYIKTKISQGKVVKGMTKEHVIASWGHPYDIDRSVNSSGVHEEWRYGYKHYGFSWYYRWIPTNFLYFKNGKLDSWQNL